MGRTSSSWLARCFQIYNPPFCSIRPLFFIHDDLYIVLRGHSKDNKVIRPSLYVHLLTLWHCDEMGHTCMYNISLTTYLGNPILELCTQCHVTTHISDKHLKYRWYKREGSWCCWYELILKDNPSTVYCTVLHKQYSRTLYVNSTVCMANVTSTSRVITCNVLYTLVVQSFNRLVLSLGCVWKLN